MTEIKASLARVMKERRAALGLSQMALAERADISSSYVGDLETCRKFPDADMIEVIAEALCVRPYRLFMAERDISEVAETAGREVAYAALGKFRDRVKLEMDAMLPIAGQHAGAASTVEVSAGETSVGEPAAGGESPDTENKPR